MDFEYIELKKFDKADFSEFVIAGDVSATNTSLCIAGIKEESIELLFILRFKSQELDGISGALNETLKYSNEKFDIQITHACLSPAGPINAERDLCKKLTNTEWGIDVKQSLSATMLNSIALINDFEAIGFGIQFLDENNKDDLVELAHPGNKMPKPSQKCAKGIVGAGTGLGKSVLFFNDKKELYVPNPSEGGHDDLPVIDEFEFKLMKHIHKLRGGDAPVDYEDVLSGRGLTYIYDFLIHHHDFKKNEVTEDINSAEDKAAAISKHSKKDPACKKCFEIFIKFYARALRNLTLDVMARGGMYIAGGIAAKNMDFFTDGALMEEFEINHTQHGVLKEIPVFIVTNYNISLYGAANVAAHFPELAIKK